MEEILSKIWMEVLNLEKKPSETESFFDLGGNSFFAAQVCQDFEEETGKTIEIYDFYEHETISELITLLEERGEKANEES